MNTEFKSSPCKKAPDPLHSSGFRVPDLILTGQRLLKKSGIYVMVGGTLKQIFKALIFGRFLSFGSKKMRTVAAKPNREDLGLIAKLAEEGRLKPVIEKIYPLEKTAEAMRYAGEGHAKGKVVIVVSGSQDVN